MKPPFLRRLRIYRIVLQTRIRYSGTTMDIFSRLLFLIGRLLLLVDRTTAAAYILRAHRNARTVKRQRRIETLMKGHGLLQPEIVGGLVPTSFRHEQFFYGRVLKVKERHESEKGVLIVKFSETFSKLRREFDVARILEDYYVVLEPSYSGFCDPEILYFMEYSEHPVIVQAADQMDVDFINRLDSNLIPINIGSSDWTNDRIFHPLGSEKIYDCIMVALWNDIKRHYLLFQAMRQMRDPDYRVCLVGGGWGRLMQDYKEMAACYGVLDQIDFYEMVPSDEVNRLLNLSRLNLLLTLKEGANKSIFEGFFADVPGLILSNNIGVNRNYINEHTGVIVDQHTLAEALHDLKTGPRSFSPHAWAMEHISCEASTRKLEALLRKTAAERGVPFTGRLSVKVNPEMDYYHEDDRLSPFEYDNYRKTT